MSINPIHLTLSADQSNADLSYQYLHIDITSPDGIIVPGDLNTLTLPDGMNWRQGVIIGGKGPVWLYGFLVHECHPAKWVGCYDPRLGAVVVSTHCKEASVGQVLDVTLSSLS
ncbi:MAG: CRISPR-associated ring nuclease Crn3/Csx3 [Cyanobacteria bacterium P01_F01_bin.33]